MTKRSRRLLFWVFVVFFAASSILVVFLAQGWRFDFETLKFSKTGGIFIKTSVDEVKIYINDQYVKTTGGILSYSTLIGNLIPKNYSIFVYKEGYYPWNKIITVESGLVSELNNIVLIPLEFKKTQILEIPSTNVSDFSVNEKNKTVIITDKLNKKVSTFDFTGKNISIEKYKIATSSEIVIAQDKNKELFVLNNKISIRYLNDSNKKPIKKSGEVDVISEYEPPIKFYDWIYDSEHIVWFAGNELNIAELDNRGGKRNTVKFYLSIISKVFFDRQMASLYYFETINKKLILYKLSLED